ncbi:MAG: FkbM family methyltransferase, partial [Alphaproteobacteria bacterium]|nr:FkbM family methyltransferase [Alphaproteobacteria bacterium]
DAFLAEEPARDIDILHADIQGYELDMLVGARQALAERRIRRIFVSTHSQTLHHNVVQLLNDSGYRVDVSADFDRETTSFDGFAYACLPDLPPLLNGVDILGRAAICRSEPRELVDYLGRALDARPPLVRL